MIQAIPIPPDRRALPLTASLSHWPCRTRVIGAPPRPAAIFPCTATPDCSSSGSRAFRTLFSASVIEARARDRRVGPSVVAPRPHRLARSPGAECAYLIQENRILRRQVGRRLLRFTGDDRRRLAIRFHRLGRPLCATSRRSSRPTHCCDGTGSWWRAGARIRGGEQAAVVFLLRSGILKANDLRARCKVERGCANDSSRLGFAADAMADVVDRALRSPVSQR